MDARKICLPIAGAFAALLLGCASWPAARQPEVQRYPASSAIVARGAPARPAAAVPCPVPGSAATTLQPSDSPVQKNGLPVTNAEYRETLGEVRRLINTLNSVIASQDYEAWLGYLTPAYVAAYGDPRTLAKLSDEPLLKRQGIRLESIRDYFAYVVVPSRTEARVDDLDFIAKDHVRAITIVDGKRYILYDLRHFEGHWRIGVS